MITAHSDIVGSLLQPPGLRAARDDFAAGRIAAEDLQKAEDRAVDGAVELQEAAGLEIVTDGEMRRLSFQSQMTEAVEGFAGAGLDAFLWGDWRGHAPLGSRQAARPRGLGLTGRLKRRRALSVDEFIYLKARTTRTPKVTLPSPGLFANFYMPRTSREFYPTIEDFLADVAAILRQEVEELARLGATYIQIDAPHYPLLLDPRTRGFYESRGWSAGAWLDRGIALDNAVMAPLPGVTFGFHLCRGNQASRWLAEGSYDGIAETVFRGIAAERLLLEYDDARSGSFEPLGLVPDGKMVVLGLITTKRGDLEDPGELAARIAEASAYIPVERLALSPQCGFSSSVEGNAVSPEDQAQKLRLVAETAKRVWGS